MSAGRLLPSSPVAPDSYDAQSSDGSVFYPGETSGSAASTWDDFFERYTCTLEPDVRLKFRKRYVAVQSEPRLVVEAAEVISVQFHKRQRRLSQSPRVYILQASRAQIEHQSDRQKSSEGSPKRTKLGIHSEYTAGRLQLLYLFGQFVVASQQKVSFAGAVIQRRQ